MTGLKIISQIIFKRLKLVTHFQMNTVLNMVFHKEMCSDLCCFYYI